jgi:hypothetical protein
MKRTFTDLSTAHLKPGHVHKMDRLIRHGGLTVGYVNDCGFFIHISFAASGHCPEPLRHILMNVDTDYVCFDADAPINPDFETFLEEWE